MTSEQRETTVGALTAADLGSVVDVEGLRFDPLIDVTHNVDEDGAPGAGTEIKGGPFTMWMDDADTPCTVTTPDAVAEGGQR